MAELHGNAGRRRPDLAARNRERATHGMTKTRTWKAWQSMRERCSNPNHAAYQDYGGRGIQVCARWEGSFAAFLDDMGEAPRGGTLDRIDNNRGYEPGNCRWASMRQQGNNRRSNVRVEWRGEVRTVAEWAATVGLERKTLEWRIRNGWDPERALNTPPIIRRK